MSSIDNKKGVGYWVIILEKDDGKIGYEKESRGGV
jgi:hypothetical protein